jgi:hypothetical protein
MGHSLRLISQLFEPTTRFLDFAKSSSPNEINDTASPEDGVLALYDNSLLLRRGDVSLLTLSCLVCLQICQTFVDQITPNLNVSHLSHVSVNG